MAKTKTEPMVEHRVTVVVRYEIDGGVPALFETVETLTQALADFKYNVVAQSAKTVRVPVSENGAGK